MTALLSVYSSTRFLGSCNARCYDGTLPSEMHDRNHHFCLCICGGLNHAVGLSRALKNVAQGVGLARADLEAYAQYRGLNNIDDLIVIDRTRVNTDYKARRIAKARLCAPEIGPGDLFYCEGLEAPIAT